MKGVVVSLCITALIVIGSVVYTNHIDNVSAELVEKNDSVMMLLEKADYDGAENAAEEMLEYLNEKRTVLAATGNHDVIDKMEMNVSELMGYIGGRQQTDAISKCKVLDFMFEHLPKNYEMKMENIL